MWRTGRIRQHDRSLRFGSAVAALAVGLFLFVTPVAVGVGVSGPPVAPAVAAQAGPPSSQQPAPAGSPQPAQPVNQRAVVGTAGIVLIALVLLSRKARKKPVFGTWRPKK